jgi:hypothetical protein
MLCYGSKEALENDPDAVGKYYFYGMDGSPYVLPFIMLLVALAFFGLDQVGAELESPFGVDIAYHSVRAA